MKVATYINNEWIIDSIFNLYPNVSFPEIGVPDSFLQENGLYKVIEYIDHDSLYKNIVKLNVPKLINGIVYTVEIIDRTQEEIYELKWQKIRSARNSLLVASDFYVLSDRWEKYDQTTKNFWSDYRQKLRDLTINFVNPDDVIWPVKPV